MMREQKWITVLRKPVTVDGKIKIQIPRDASSNNGNVVMCNSDKAVRRPIITAPHVG